MMGPGSERAAPAKVEQAAQAIAQDWPRSCVTLMPAVIDAFLNQANMGGVQKVLQQVFGYVYTGV